MTTRSQAMTYPLRYGLRKQPVSIQEAYLKAMKALVEDTEQEARQTELNIRELNRKMEERRKAMEQVMARHL